MKPDFGKYLFGLIVYGLIVYVALFVLAYLVFAPQASSSLEEGRFYLNAATGKLIETDEVNDWLEKRLTEEKSN